MSYGFSGISVRRRGSNAGAIRNAGKRTVFPSREIYHLWANETQARARNGTDTVSFAGPNAFSYRAVIGRIVRNAKGERAYLVSNRQWSVTTSGHQSMLRSAIPQDEPVFHLADIPHFADSDLAHDDVLADYARRIEETIGRLNRATKRGDWHLSDLRELKAEADLYCAFYGLTAPFDGQSVEALIAERGPQLAQAAKERAARERELTRQKKIKLAGEADAWRAGQISRTYYPDTLLRITADGREVETSRGARVPLTAAQVAYRALAAGVDITGQPIGYFRVSRVTPTQLTIGCHVISRKEIDRLATTQNWKGTTA